MLECIICSKDCIDEYYVKCELCSDWGSMSGGTR